jgi:hypothetical protein
VRRAKMNRESADRDSVDLKIGARVNGVLHRVLRLRLVGPLKVLSAASLLGAKRFVPRTRCSEEASEFI